MHVIITPLDYDCNLVTLQCRKGGKSSAFAVLGVCVSKVKTSRRNSLEPVCQLHLGLPCSCTLTGLLILCSSSGHSASSRADPSLQQLPGGAGGHGGFSSAGAGVLPKGRFQVFLAHSLVHVRAQQALPKPLWSSQNLGATCVKLQSSFC